MPFTGTDFIDLADRLMALATRGESDERSAISRAYYGAFLHARDYVDAEFAPVTNKPGVHVAVRKQIEPVNQKIAFDLRQLHEWRRMADYDVPHPSGNVAQAAVDAIELAREIVGAVNALPRTASI